ncbi:ABC transporter ATP-binding protein/permease [Peptoniphilus sp. MSJ-1]|uniref:ABC transporter ATP-binding protein/permease n=1 Tax=Peptoniphilus ovalis TaxID=2841503 RepID=A0ABS6FIX1_9FIRM|nr:ABC transporter ATP-binding protein [Peptoniphilus ovalis]MBU5669926.1 ABC transporter ATP-binding protein/permease [Peptoniphilus ovalis]
MNIFKGLNKYKIRILVVILLTFGNALGELFLPRLMSLVIDKGVAYGDTNYVLRMGGVMIIVVIFTVLCRGSAAYHSSKTTMAFSRDLRYKLFRKINYLSFDDVESFSISSLITRTTDDVNQVEQMVLMGLRPLVRGPLMFIGGLIMALSTNVKLSIVFPIAIPFIAFGLFYVIKKGLPYFPVLQQRLDKLNELFRRRLTGLRVIRAFSKDEYEEDLFDDANKSYKRLAVRVNKLLVTIRPILGTVLNFGIIFVLYFGAKLIDIRELGIGELMAYIQYITQVLIAMIMMSFLLTMVPRTMASVSRINEVLEYETTKTGGEEILDEDIYKIEAKNLNFAYPDANQCVLKDINFEVNKGETLGIIGGTGSGKSTLLRLLLQFYEPGDNELLINGIDIKKLKNKSVREKLSYVPQENFFFSKSARENLMYSDKDAKDDKMLKSLQEARAIDYLGDEPLDKEIARGGANLSGGQKQRLSIARALTRNASVYVFDDSFSALDYKTDYELRQVLKNTLSDKIVIVVAQRVATILNVDKILVLEDGEVAGYGSHDELMKTNEVYREIAVSQGQKYEE